MYEVRLIYVVNRRVPLLTVKGFREWLGQCNARFVAQCLFGPPFGALVRI